MSSKESSAILLQELPVASSSASGRVLAGPANVVETVPPTSPETTRKAWLSVVGAFFYLFASYGFMQTIGTVQAYLEVHQLAAYSSRDVGWITGCFTALALLFGIQVGPVFDVYGPQYMAPIGCAVYIPVFFVLAECEQYWHFLLVLGLWGPVGGAIVSMVGVGVVSKWFTRRRGMAMGMALCGSSIGGVVMPLMLRSLLPRLGWAWSIRIVAFLIAGILLLGSLCLQGMPPSTTTVRRSRRAVLNFKALRSWTFAFVTIGLASLEFAIFGVFSLLPTYASAAHYTADTGYTLVAVCNATSTLGRFLAGAASDHFGHFNTLLCMIVITTAFTAAILVPFGASSLGALYAFSALWGFGSGSFISLTPVCMGQICDTEDYGRYFGTMYFFASFALFISTPLGGQMLETCGTRALASLYVGVVALGGISFFMARRCLYRKKGLRVWSKI